MKPEENTSLMIDCIRCPIESCQLFVGEIREHPPVLRATRFGRDVIMMMSSYVFLAHEGSVRLQSGGRQFAAFGRPFAFRLVPMYVVVQSYAYMDEGGHTLPLAPGETAEGNAPFLKKHRKMDSMPRGLARIRRTPCSLSRGSDTF